MNQGSKVIGYVRVSTAEQGGSGLGIDAQRRVIEEACAAKGWELAGVEVDVASGKSTRRPGLTRALAVCKGGSVQGLVAAKLDRLSRSTIDFCGLVERARNEGWQVAVLDVDVDTASPQGELISTVLAAVAQWERRLIGQRTKEALAEARARGVQLGRRGSAERRPELAAWVRRQRGRGATLQQIADTLNENGEPGPTGGRWYPSAVSRYAKP